MGALAAAHLRRAGAAEIVVLNRSAERAQRLVHNTRRTGIAARSAPLEALADELATADLLVACTGAVGTVVARETVAAAVVARDGRPLAVCDLGLPRDVDPGVAALPGVTVVDLVTLQAPAGPPRARRGGRAAQELVAEEAQAYLAARRSAEVTPTVTALRRRAAEVIDAELLRLDARLPALDPAVREEFGQTVRRVVDKLLHTPTVQVKRLAEGPDGSSYAHALRELFELDPQTPAAVAVQRHGDVLAALEAPMQAVREIRIPASHLAHREAPGGAPVTAPARRCHSASAPGPARWPSPSPSSSRSGCALPATPSSWSPSAPPVTVRPPRSPRSASACSSRSCATRSWPVRSTSPCTPTRTSRRPRTRGSSSPRSRRGRTRATRWSPGTAGCSGSCPPERRSAPGHRGASPSSRPSASACARVPIRGNVDTRIGKVRSGELDAVVVAAAGLRRLGRIDEASELLDPLQMLPAPAQGALAVECRAADTALAALLAQVLDDEGARAAVTAERAVLATLEAGCSAPVGALADVVSDLTDDGRVVDRVFLRAVVGTGDGALLRASATGRPRRRREARCGARRRAARHGGWRAPHRDALGSDSSIGSRSMNRAPSTPGRVAFVGSGPGDPGLLTVRARDALGGAPLVVTDPDVPDGVLALVADGAEVRPAVGEPAEVAADLVAEATAGRSVVRLVGGDPLTADAVVAETLAVAAAGVPFDVVPGVARGHRGADLRRHAARLGARRGRRACGRPTGRRSPPSPARSCCTPRPPTWPTSSRA